MFNKVILIGRLTKEPELRYTAQSNIPVASFTIAVNRAYGEKQADFINCQVWRKQAESVKKYLDKGSLIAVDGRLQTRDYLDEKTSTKKYITEVVCDSVTFLDTKNKESSELPSGDKVEDDLPF